MATTKKPHDRHQVGWKSTPWAPPPEAPKPPPLPKTPTAAARKAAARKAAAEAAAATPSTRTETGSRCTQTPRAGPRSVKSCRVAATRPPTRKERRAAVLQRRRDYRDGLVAVALGGTTLDPLALASIGIATALRRDHSDDGTPCDVAWEAMEKAAGQELPTTGPWAQSIIDAYHRGVDVRRERDKARALREGKAAQADKALREGGNVQRLSIPRDTKPISSRLAVRVTVMGDPLVCKAFYTPHHARSSRQWFRLEVVPPMSNVCDRVHVPKKQGLSGGATVRVSTNVLPLWLAGQAHAFGENSLVVAVDPADPLRVLVATQIGPYTYRTGYRRLGGAK